MSELFSFLGIALSLLGWVFIVVFIVLRIRRRRRNIVVSRRKRWQWWVLAVVMWISGTICLQVAKHQPHSSSELDAAVAQLNGPISSSSTTVATPDSDTCVEQWTDAYRKEKGQDTVVTQDQLDEWAQWCTQGKAAP